MSGTHARIARHRHVLHKALTKKGREAIAEQVDFEKEKLVAILWDGSGTDKVTYNVGKCGGINLTFDAGRGADLPHQRVLIFAVAKDASVQLLIRVNEALPG